ncbi:MAG: hypothetical protein ACR2OB_02725 [Solirubrobacteraceae bacterium]
MPRTAQADESVMVCGAYPNQVFTPSSAYGITARSTCPGGAIALQAYGASYNQGQGAIWQANAPAGLTIVAAGVPSGSLRSDYVNAGSNGSYGGDFYWAGGSSNIASGETGVLLGPFGSSYLGFLLVCGKRTCTNLAGPGDIYVLQMTLAVRETSGPWLSSPNGLWQANGWVRGDWTLAFRGDSPSGLCGLVADLGGQALPGTSSPRDPSTWHQCGAGPVSDTVVTQGYGQGAETLHIGAWDAAGQTVNDTKTVYVDNQQPEVALSGPADAPTTAGTQYVTATATAGPSGVAGLSCSVDGAPGEWYPGASAQVPVNGVGQHIVQCWAANNAVDGSGNHGWSIPQSQSLKIGVPTIGAIGFSRIVDALRCHRVRERIKVTARWVKVRRHHKLVRVHRRAHHKTVRVTRCHARTKREWVTVPVTVRRNGKKVHIKRRKIVRVVLLPRVVNHASHRVAHGHQTTVSGWLGTIDGSALPGQTVSILTSPDNGQGQFSTAAVVSTAANGSWTARLPAGPSRLVEAAYGGGPTTEATNSAQVRLVVPADVKLLRVIPRKVPWGGTVRLVGRLEGGYLPAGGALVRLRIGLGSTFTTYGVHEHVGGDGRFTTSYTFGAGVPSVHRSFWFQVASLPMGDYPYAPASSRRLSVLVGGHPTHRSRRGRKQR